MSGAELQAYIGNALLSQDALAYWQKRYEELLASCPNKDACLSRVRMEVFCLHRRYLPLRGLDKLASALEEEGFRFGRPQGLVVETIFPEGWTLEPHDDFPRMAYFGFLVDPNHKRRASFFYWNGVKKEVGISPIPG